MINTLAIIVIVLFAALLIYVATEPDIFHVRRTTSIKAPSERIFALI